MSLITIWAWILLAGTLIALYVQHRSHQRKMEGIMALLDEFQAARTRLVNAANATLDHVQGLKETMVGEEEVKVATADMHSVSAALENMVKGNKPAEPAPPAPEPPPAA